MRLAAFLTMSLIIGWAAPARAGGYGTYRAFTGTTLPTSASVFVLIDEGPLFPGPYRMGWMLDLDGDSQVDVADLSPLDTSAEQIAEIYSAHVSPADPTAVYMFYRPSTGAFAIAVYRRTESGWTRVGQPHSIPVALAATGGVGGNRLPDRAYLGVTDLGWTGVSSVVKLRDGSDAILVVASRVMSVSNPDRGFESSYCVFVDDAVADDADADSLADGFRDSVSFDGIEGCVVLDDGSAVVRRIAAPNAPSETREFIHLAARPRNNAESINTPNSFVGSSAIAKSLTDGRSEGWLANDTGTQRHFFGGFRTGRYSVDSSGSPLPQTIGPADVFPSGGFIPWNASEFFVGADGDRVGSAQDYRLASDTDAAAVWRDPDFNDIVANSFGAPLEVQPILYEQSLPNPRLVGISLASLPRIPLTSGGASIRFRDSGEFEEGEAFTFRFGGVARDRLWVSDRGLVSFIGPVGGAASVERLAGIRGVIAPAWSDRWDTSEVQVFAGYAPVTKSFAPGNARVLAYVVEWRYLRDPEWEPNRSFNIRLVLYSDGTYRTDYGAIDETDEPFVVGFSGLGLHPVTGTVNLPDHSWGGTPAGTTGERVLSQLFTSLPPIGHRMHRWLGYPERLDAATPQPAIIAPKLASGKLSLKAAGSNIQPGARLVVDGIEAFDLARSANGKKWVVKKASRSVPSGRSVSAVLAGSGHELVVFNPDGSASPYSSF